MQLYSFLQVQFISHCVNCFLFISSFQLRYKKKNSVFPSLRPTNDSRSIRSTTIDNVPRSYSPYRTPPLSPSNDVLNSNNFLDEHLSTLPGIDKELLSAGDTDSSLPSHHSLLDEFHPIEDNNRFNNNNNPPLTEEEIDDFLGVPKNSNN